MACSLSRWLFLSAVIAVSGATMAAAQIVVPTAEGQIGIAPPGVDDEIVWPRFESIRGQPGDVILGGITIFGGAPPPPPEMAFLTDMIHEYPDPVPITSFSGSFDNTFPTSPGSARSRNAADNGDFVAFSFAVDGTLPQTMTVRIATFDENGNSLTNVPIENIDTFPDPSISRTAVAVDDQGRMTVAYTELTATGPRVNVNRFDATTGTPLGGLISITPTANLYPDIALLDPAGNRLIIPTVTPTGIVGNILDTSGPTPVVLPEFPISTTPALANTIPAVAADPTTGAFTVAWENITGDAGDPINIRARRFDAMGNPIGDDFIANAVTANTQGQPAVAYSATGESVIVWAGDAPMGADQLDVFGQAYDAQGQPIGGPFRANTQTGGSQDRPTVRFLPEPDGQGRPQFTVVWRDVTDAFDGTPQGTGTGYRCFTISDEDPSAIFADGFESGDTSSWSDGQP